MCNRNTFSRRHLACSHIQDSCFGINSICRHPNECLHRQSIHNEMLNTTTSSGLHNGLSAQDLFGNSPVRLKKHKSCENGRWGQTDHTADMSSSTQNTENATAPQVITEKSTQNLDENLDPILMDQNESAGREQHEDWRGERLELYESRRPVVPRSLYHSHRIFYSSVQSNYAHLRFQALTTSCCQRCRNSEGACFDSFFHLNVNW